MKSPEGPRKIPETDYSEVPNSPEYESLVEQFDHPKKLTIGGAEILVVDIAPEKLKSETPTLYVPGFSANPLALKDAILRTAEAGRRVISAYAPHGIRETWQGQLPNAQARKLELLLQLQNELGLRNQKLNIICDSEAFLAVAAMGQDYPERIENIVAVEPAGFMQKDNSFALVIRALEDMYDVYIYPALSPLSTLSAYCVSRPVGVVLILA